jgi:hypothetical protein
MAASPMDLFVTLSSALCGIAADKLAPGIDPIDIKQTYFDTVQQEDPAVFAQLLKIVADNPALPPQQLADLVLLQSGDDIRFLGRAIMLAWYLGNWYQPANLKIYSVPDPKRPPIPVRVISMDAYTKGWAWSVAQAHPMGFSTNVFGYWGAAPPSLDDYIGSGS